MALCADHLKLMEGTRLRGVPLAMEGPPYEKWSGIAPATAACSLNIKGLTGIRTTSLLDLLAQPGS